MAFGFFDPPQTKAHKRAAVAACKMREQSGRDANIELGILLTWHNQGVRLANQCPQDMDEALGHLYSAMRAAKDTIDRTNSFSDTFLREVLETQSEAKSANDFEKLANLEIEGRECLLLIRDEARERASILGAACIDVQGRMATATT